MYPGLKVLEYCLKNQPKSIGILGLARSGKDTVGQLLAERLEGYVLTRYAAPLKEASRAVFGHGDDSLKHIPLWNTQDLHDDIVRATENMCTELGLQVEAVFAELPELLNLRSISPRILQQKLGDAVRKVDEQAFVRYTQAGDTPRIITDVRFGNELCEYNILVYRKGIQALGHGSEQYAQHIKRYMEMRRSRVAHFDGKTIVLIDNSGSIEDLKRNLIG